MKRISGSKLFAAFAFASLFIAILATGLHKKEPATALNAEKRGPVRQITDGIVYRSLCERPNRRCG